MRTSHSGHASTTKSTTATYAAARVVPAEPAEASETHSAAAACAAAANATRPAAGTRAAITLPKKGKSTNSSTLSSMSANTSVCFSSRDANMLAANIEQPSETEFPARAICESMNA